MNNAFPGIFKEEEKKRMEVQKEGSFKINQAGSIASSQAQNKRKVSYD